jgi:hypothetical protein
MNFLVMAVFGSLRRFICPFCKQGSAYQAWSHLLRRGGGKGHDGNAGQQAAQPAQAAVGGPEIVALRLTVGRRQARGAAAEAVVLPCMQL